MTTYIVEEVVLYRVEADTEAEAIAEIVNNPNRDELAIGVDDRYAYPEDER